MTFWIIAAGAALILAFFLFRTLISPVPTDESETQLAIYKDQLSEIERDEARGTLTADEAKRLRTEVSAAFWQQMTHKKSPPNPCLRPRSPLLLRLLLSHCWAVVCGPIQIGCSGI